MASVADHYDAVLAAHYTWISGGHDARTEDARAFFVRHALVPDGPATAIDLGAGPGFQSLALARLGYAVTAIDLSRPLLDELTRRASGLPIRVVHDDLCRLGGLGLVDAALCVCMGDTLTHLPSTEAVGVLFRDVLACLRPGGRFVVTLRDFSAELRELDRFIPVRADDKTVFMCFLEYEPSTVKVHDLVHTRTGGTWTFKNSFYRKLRLGPAWLDAELRRAGFENVVTDVNSGLITLQARRPSMALP